MLNAIRFVVPDGGGFALFALTACRNVHPAPHVDPSVSAVDLTVNVMAGVGVGVGVTSGESVTVWEGTLTERAAHRFWPKATSAREMPIRQQTRPIKTCRLKKADWLGEFFFMSFNQRPRSESLRA
jgi:hypothetical protein